MLVFLRKKAALIATIIVVAMVLTLFAGTLFLGGQESPTAAQSSENAVAILNGTPISSQQYSEILNQFIQRYKLDGSQKQDPEFIEVLQYTAFEQALQTAVLLNAANAAEIEPRDRDIDGAIQGLLIQYDLKDVDQLKDKLKEAGYPWKEFKAKIENDVKIQLFASYLQSSVKVTQLDIDNVYTETEVQQLFIRVTPGDKDAESKAKERADAYFSQLKNGVDFSVLAEKYSDDVRSKSKGGNLGWIPFGTTVPEFETAMYALEPGEISRPFRTPFGFHIIKILDKKSVGKANFTNVEAEKTRLLQLKQQNAVGNYIRGLISQSQLEIKDPYLRAYYSKITGDDKGAIDAYQTQQSMNTYDPRPHYLLSNLYKTQGNREAQLLELQRAVLKGSLSPQADIPMAHLALGIRYGQSGNIASQNQEFDLAINLSKGHLMVMKSLEKAFKDANENRRASLVAAEIMRIESMMNQASATNNSAAGAPALKL